MQAKGVDSLGSGFADPASFIRELAKKEREYAPNITGACILNPCVVRMCCCDDGTDRLGV